ncbi:MAG: DMT family transporter [Candidatus Freyarchaeota archaeon]|nr:DMT family transporter [Candidatus Jordarchaeia archaeon]MBS7278787.1 DMT family transporter [Candidatus Jordarchaeia archaeon]
MCAGNNFGGIVSSHYQVWCGLGEPHFFAAISALVGAGFMLLVLKLRGELRKLFTRELLGNLFLIGFFGTLLSSILFFIGSTMTSGINASILLQTEPIFSIILSFFLLGELIRKKQIAATLLVLCGTIIVLYNGVLSINAGDILILLTPLAWQIGHVYARKTFEKTNTFIVAAGRVLYGGVLLFLLSLNPSFRQYQLLTDVGIILLFLFQGIIVYIGSILVWYEAIKRINLSKATAIIAPYPVFSVILAWIFPGEKVSIYQLAGLAIIIAGIILLSRIRSEKREKSPKGSNGHRGSPKAYGGQKVYEVQPNLIQGYGVQQKVNVPDYSA